MLKYHRESPEVWLESGDPGCGRGASSPRARYGRSGGRAVGRSGGRRSAIGYADEWIVGIEDVTPLAREVHGLVRAGELDEAAAPLPEERPYPVADEVLAHLRR